MARRLQRPILEEIYRLHIRLYRDLNDLHIFAGYTSPLLKEAADNHIGEVIDPDKDVEFSVPGKRHIAGVARRNSTQLSSLLRRFGNEELFANLLITAVSKFEFYLASVMTEFLRRKPEKLLLGLKGGDSGKPIPLQKIVDASSLIDIYEDMIEQRIVAVFYAEPKEYCTYFNAISELGLKEKLFEHLFEIKATRDLIVHNSLLVNELYLKKSGDLARGKLGDRLKVNKTYFEHTLSEMKTIASTIQRLSHKKHGKD